MRKKLICMALTTAALSAAILAGCGKQGEKTENTCAIRYGSVRQFAGK